MESISAAGLAAFVVSMISVRVALRGTNWRRSNNGYNHRHNGKLLRLLRRAPAVRDMPPDDGAMPEAVELPDDYMYRNKHGGHGDGNNVDERVMASPCRECPRDAYCVHFCPAFRAWFRPAWDDARDRVWRYAYGKARRGGGGP